MWLILTASYKELYFIMRNTPRLRSLPSHHPTSSASPRINPQLCRLRVRTPCLVRAHSEQRPGDYPRCLSTLPIRAAYPRCLFALPIRAAYPRCLSTLPIRVAYPRCLSTLPIHAAYPRCLSAPPIRTAYPHCLSALPIGAAAVRRARNRPD